MNFYIILKCPIKIIFVILENYWKNVAIPIQMGTKIYLEILVLINMKGIFYHIYMATCTTPVIPVHMCCFRCITYVTDMHVLHLYLL